MKRILLLLVMTAGCPVEPPPPPGCGDGVADFPAEECDTADLRGLTCGVFRGNTGAGELSCDEVCVFDLSLCEKQ